MNENNNSGEHQDSMSLVMLISKFDRRYFGDMNTNPVLKVLGMAKLDAEVIDYTNFTMSTFIRMPYSNNWRVRTNKEAKPYLVHNCPTCTVPARFVEKI